MSHPHIIPCARKTPIERLSESRLVTPVKQMAKKWEICLEAVEYMELLNQMFNVRMESARIFVDVETEQHGLNRKRVYRLVVQSSINPALYWVKETP